MEIHEAFDRLVTALENNDMKLLDDVLLRDIIIYSSHLGTIQGLAQAKAKLTWQGMPTDLAKIRVFNNVVRKAGNAARQSVYLAMLFGKEINGFLHHLQCGFQMAAAYALHGDGWKISEIRLNMVYETGNTLLVANWWKLIDYHQFEGNNLHLIDKLAQSPWAQVPQTDTLLSEEDEVRQLFWHYNWMLDTNNIAGIYDLTTENCYPADRYSSRNDWLDTLAEKRQKEACWAHISSFETIVMKDGGARAVIYRCEPNRIGNKFLHKHNISTVYFSATWNIDFIKTPQGWKMDRFGHKKGIVEQACPMTKRYF